MQDTEEIWKDVIGYEGLYQVSSIGRVKSSPRNGTPVKTENIISFNLNRCYPSLKLSKDNKIIRHSIHRLMGFAFLMDYYFKGAVINHKNGIKTDNRIDNLEWCTNSENCQHAWDTGLCKSARYWSGRTGVNHHRSKPVIQYDLNGKPVKEYPSETFASKETGFSRQHISRCCAGSQKQSNGFIWKHKT